MRKLIVCCAVLCSIDPQDDVVIPDLEPESVEVSVAEESIPYSVAITKAELVSLVVGLICGSHLQPSTLYPESISFMALAKSFPVYRFVNSNSAGWSSYVTLLYKLLIPDYKTNTVLSIHKRLKSGDLYVMEWAVSFLQGLQVDDPVCIEWLRKAGLWLDEWNALDAKEIERV